MSIRQQQVPPTDVVGDLFQQVGGFETLPVPLWVYVEKDPMGRAAPVTGALILIGGALYLQIDRFWIETDAEHVVGVSLQDIRNRWGENGMGTFSPMYVALRNHTPAPVQQVAFIRGVLWLQVYDIERAAELTQMSAHGRAEA